MNSDDAQRRWVVAAFLVGAALLIWVLLRSGDSTNPPRWDPAPFRSGDADVPRDVEVPSRFASSATAADDAATAADPTGQRQGVGGIEDVEALIDEAGFCASRAYQSRLLSLLWGRARALGIDVPRDIRMSAGDWAVVMKCASEHELLDARAQAKRLAALMSAVRDSNLEVEIDRSNQDSNLASVEQDPGARPGHFLMQGGKAIVVPWGTNAELDALTEAIYQENERFVAAVLPTLRKYLPR